MTAIVGWCIFIVLAAIAAMHVAWGFGVRWPRRSETELVTTVEAYLDNDGNVAATAKQLFTHRHTVRYRLERVRELCGHDVSATEGREKLGLGLKAMRVLGIASPRGPALEPGAGGGKVRRSADD